MTSVTIQVDETKSGIRITIKYDGHSFGGSFAASYIRAFESAIETVKNVKRRFRRGRPSDRYKAARALLANRLFAARA